MSKVDALKKSAEHRAEESYKRAVVAIKKLTDEGRQITFASVAEKANVSRTYLYNHRELKAVILKKRKTTGEMRDASLATVIKMQKVEIDRLRRELKEAKIQAEKAERLEIENKELRAQLRTAYKY